ncbi:MULTISPECIES: protein adenylyltransferase SelO [unclassified Xanthobacter]|uniref:protein adenylyltransferase SelO n=1 Tax=unclassified Xanthobacter TaxID=2623496 RepID=UPI001EE0FD7F|nr:MULTISPECIES: YdiU family protein [unclassified Xanthobacter]
MTAIADTRPLHIPFDNSYARLPEGFFAPSRPTPVAKPGLIKINAALASELGLDPQALATPEAVAMFAGVDVPEGAEPIALAYAGHQFGQFVPQLGDGRAVLLGEVIDQAGRRRDIQLKGSGPTAFSRRGDGRAALGPVLREYLISEAMAALGVPTTRTLAAVTTGEPVWRERALPGAVLARVAASHIRIGTFQYFAARKDTDALKALADYALARHYPEAAGAARPYAALLEGVMARQAALVARWQLIGFIHGVMNTDNMSISGETIDYGPCAFMDGYDATTVFSSIDHMGRYAYGNQPQIAHWNLARLAECLIPLLNDDRAAAVDEANALLATFPDRFKAAYHAGLLAKIGLADGNVDDLELAFELLALMADAKADFTLTFRRLGAAAESADNLAAVRDLFLDREAFDAWAARWRLRIAAGGRTGSAARADMERVNPLFIPRNHLVEWALVAAVEEGDTAPFEELLGLFSHPFDEQPRFASYAALPPQMSDYQTFCGT